jgi:phosphate:Na+ symporter
LIWIAFIDQLAYMAIAISPTAEGLEGADRMAEEVPRQVANAATIWAILNVIIFLPFVGLFARLVQRLVPDQVEPETMVVRAKYLDEELLNVPAIALERVRLELGHMGEWVQAMLDDLPAAMRAGSVW